MSAMINHLPFQPYPTKIVDLVDYWASKTPSGIAADFEGEEITYAELRSSSLHVSRALLSAGVRPRDKVPLLTAMSLEMIPAVVGILRVGACFAPIDLSVWGRSRIEAVLLELSAPLALVTSHCPGLQLPVLTVNFQKEWLKQPFEGCDEVLAKLDVIQNQYRDDHLAWIIFTSGTTGKPKGVMVYHRGIRALIPEFREYDQLESDVEARGVRCLLAASVAFDGCQTTMWGTLRKGRTLVMATPSNFHEVAATCEVLTLTPSMLAALDPAGPYDRVRIIFLGAEAPSREIYRHWIRPNRRVINTYGPSETTCIVSMAVLSAEEEPTFGEFMSSVKVVLVDDNLHEVDEGEVMISGPGLAAGYLNNDELTTAKFINWHGQRFYRTGDLARRRADGQLVFLGRADSLVKNRGVLINLEMEVEAALQSFDSVRGAVAFKTQTGRLTGCVQPASVNVDELREFLRKRCDPFVIPDDLIAMDQFPLNVNGKTDRNALKAAIEAKAEQSSKGKEMDNGSYEDEYDALRRGFTLILHVPFIKLTRTSSFTALGGHSLAAIRLSNFLRQHGHLLSAVQILRLDKIERLVDVMMQNRAEEYASKDMMDHGPAPATDVQKLFIQRSLLDPKSCALIGVATYIGDIKGMPRASELNSAIVSAATAHQIFRTRFDLSSFTLHDLGRLNMDWREISIPDVADFESACKKLEEQAWRDLEKTTPADVEVPYCHVACVSVPGPRAISLVIRMHHVLTDFVSATLFWKDVERALAGEEIPRGPLIQDYARFIHNYRQKHLDQARRTFERILDELPKSSTLQFPSPSMPQHMAKSKLGLVRLDSQVTVTKAQLDEAARSHRVTATTIVYAAWSLFLRRISGNERVGFSISLSGRTIPWPGAQSVIGCLVNRAIFSTPVPLGATVHEWLTDMHKKTLDVIEFDGLLHGLPESLMADPRTNTTNLLCFLDLPQSSSNWSYRDQQGHNYTIDWYIFANGHGKITTEFEFQARRVDSEWATLISSLPGRFLDQLVRTDSEDLVGNLLEMV